MSTRGFLGIRNGKKLKGKYNHSDSYYSSLGIEAMNEYFEYGDILSLGGEDNEVEDSDGEDGCFLNDGLYCEYGYVYDDKKDRLEIYRGGFHTKQLLEGTKSNSGDNWFTHLVFIVDRKIHTKTMVEEAFQAFDDYVRNDEGETEDNKLYPERDVINVCEGCWKPIKVGEKACSDKCLKLLTAKAI